MLRAASLTLLSVVLSGSYYLSGQSTQLTPELKTQTYSVEEPHAEEKGDSSETFTSDAITRIGGLRISLRGADNGGLTMQLEKPPDGLVANYRFAGEGEFHGLAKGQMGGEAAISHPISIPHHVHLIEAQLDWCSPVEVLSFNEPPYSCGMATNEIRGKVYKKVRQHIVVVFIKELKSVGGDLIPAFILTDDSLEITDALINFAQQEEADTYVLNGTPIAYRASDDSPAWVHKPIVGWKSKSVRQYRIERYAADNHCREYLEEGHDFLDIERSEPAPAAASTARDNGIMVAHLKVFDSFSLRQMLSNTAAQLAGISGFNQGSIVGAFGNLQGIARDASFVSAQLTTIATPSVAATETNGVTGGSTLSNALGANNNVTLSGTNISCPAGSLPAVGSNGLPACAAVATATTGGSSLQTGVQAALGATFNSSFTGQQTNNLQNSVTTTSGGQAGVIPPTPVSTALSPPANIGVSASDVLAEQVQLNSQITTLRLLLQGSLSDKYLLKGNRAVDTRQQTTVGFGISLNPPARYKHAVAEVKIWIESAPEADPVSIMNLLPADKTYNVAKITSHQSAFGAGVVVEAVNLGVAGGRSKDRLYLAKDTDTVALQFPTDAPLWPRGQSVVARSAQERVRDVARKMEIWQKIQGACDADPGPGGPADSAPPDSVVFGWQFRPVLGADYVQAGQRTVFAQLALPVGLGGQFTPLSIHVQTRWREYDAKRQVLGAVYKGSCSIVEDPTPITVVSPLRIHKTTVDDVGGGVLKMRAEGEFLASGFSVLSGPNTIAPTTFDGHSIQFFANARDLLLADDLKLVSEDGKAEFLGMRAQFPGTCRLTGAALKAVPRPDGNSLVEVSFKTGARYSINPDGEPYPLVLIGSQVYGLHETPLLRDGPDEGCRPASAGAPPGLTCKYHFIAPTDALRTSETFSLRDLRWVNFGQKGGIDFDPAFAALATLGTKPAEDAQVCASVPPPTLRPAAPNPKLTSTCTPPALFSLTGFQFRKIGFCDNTRVTNCLEVKRGLEPITLSPTDADLVGGVHAAVLDVESNTAAVLRLPLALAPQYNYKALRFIWRYGYGSAEKIEWDLDIPPETKASISASAILNVSDSMQAVFSGVDLVGSNPTLAFDGKTITNDHKYEKDKKQLTVLITSDMTSKPGHKELTLTDDQLPPGSDPKAKKKTLQLPFDVTRR